MWSMSQDKAVKVPKQLTYGAHSENRQVDSLVGLGGAGARGEALSCQEVGARMVKRVPDVTRLLDRLEVRGLIDRHRCEEDRRVVRTVITEAGLALVNDIDAPLRRVIRRQFRNYDDRKLAQLDRLLDDLLDA